MEVNHVQYQLNMITEEEIYSIVVNNYYSYMIRFEKIRPYKDMP